MCYLIKIGISPIDIASLQLRSPSAISMARKRLARKILGDSGTIDKLDEVDTFILVINHRNVNISLAEVK